MSKGPLVICYDGSPGHRRHRFEAAVLVVPSPKAAEERREAFEQEHRRAAFTTSNRR